MTVENTMNIQGKKPTRSEITYWLLLALVSAPFIMLFALLLVEPEHLAGEAARGDVDAIVLGGVATLSAVVLIGTNPWHPLPGTIPFVLGVLALDAGLQVLLLIWPSLAVHPSMKHPSMLGTTLPLVIVYSSRRRQVLREQADRDQRAA